MDKQKKFLYHQTYYKPSDSGVLSKPSSILMVYTGGTLGMAYDPKRKLLTPFNFDQIIERIPELAEYNFELSVISFNKLIDSSNITPQYWIALAKLIGENYLQYDGFVILHGTDTMAYSASALSFLFENLNKPVVFTGAQLPIGATRTDARENIITALEVAASRNADGQPSAPEVSIYFGNKLFRGNRARKIASAQFAAFGSRNYPPLAEAGTRIYYNDTVINRTQNLEFKYYENLDNRVAILKIFPGLTNDVVEAVCSSPKLKGLIIETYGSGNAPTSEWFLRAIEKAIRKGVVVYNVSQCDAGMVIQGRYETSKILKEMGVIGGADISSEAALTKMMFLLGNKDELSTDNIAPLLESNLRGELTEVII